MKIYVDADASPVKDIIIAETKPLNIPVVLVMSFSHFSNQTNEPHVETVYVDAGADSADYRIMKLAQSGDIVVTQDYGLASLALGKGCTVLHHKGFQFTHDNIDQMMTMRYANAKARKAGFKTKGPKAFTEENREYFRNFFRNIIK
ncbi:YaiI/YqxD family protein [Virgibacillus sp. MSP4-1]|uniref:YaiI/YqxD family protein n=1 Tax=Virgibacillus sp. MSP4-1 TaxID=2700081 RepID=UPI00039A561E|nr:YaiI/YqxD family protein [Virgibacillus sp. MSP4-1]QHS22451.1 YaiI/YqxD family protein [Virgibacillus sp. MSP4-1]